MATYVSDEQLFRYVAALLHRSEVSQDADASYWRELASEANASAYGYINRALVSRGYGAATQVPNWDDGARFQKAIGAFLALQAGGALGSFSGEFLKTLDLRDDLKTVQVTISGVWQAPDGTTILEIGTGQLNTDQDEFVPFNPNDPRRGQVTRW